ncbi:unnamed protein product, partial [Notodromas monacha]
MSRILSGECLEFISADVDISSYKDCVGNQVGFVGKPGTASVAGFNNPSKPPTVTAIPLSHQGVVQSGSCYTSSDYSSELYEDEEVYEGEPRAVVEWESQESGEFADFYDDEEVEEEEEFVEEEEEYEGEEDYEEYCGEETAESISWPETRSVGRIILERVPAVNRNTVHASGEALHRMEHEMAPRAQAGSIRSPELRATLPAIATVREPGEIILSADSRIAHQRLPQMVPRPNSPRMNWPRTSANAVIVRNPPPSMNAVITTTQGHRFFAPGREVLASNSPTLTQDTVRYITPRIRPQIAVTKPSEAGVEVSTGYKITELPTSNITINSSEMKPLAMVPPQRMRLTTSTAVGSRIGATMATSPAQRPGASVLYIHQGPGRVLSPTATVSQASTAQGAFLNQTRSVYHQVIPQRKPEVVSPVRGAIIQQNMPTRLEKPTFMPLDHIVIASGDSQRIVPIGKPGSIESRLNVPQQEKYTAYQIITPTPTNHAVSSRGSETMVELIPQNALKELGDDSTTRFVMSPGMLRTQVNMDECQAEDANAALAIPLSDLKKPKGAAKPRRPASANRGGRGGKGRGALSLEPGTVPPEHKAVPKPSAPARNRKKPAKVVIMHPAMQTGPQIVFNSLPTVQSAQCVANAPGAVNAVGTHSLSPAQNA